MGTGKSSTTALPRRDSVSNVLILGTPRDFQAGTCCASSVEGVPLDEVGLIGVTFSLTPDRWIAEREDILSGVPSRMAVVCVGEQTLSAKEQSGRDSAGSLPESDGRCSVRSVTSPGNLTTLGVRITETLDEVLAVEELSLVSFCFRSISPLLLNSAPQEAFQFLQVLTGMVTAEDVRAHYHLQPGVHDDVEVERIKLLFDATVDLTDGERIDTVE